jgi:site-specific recombinase XerD
MDDLDPLTIEGFLARRSTKESTIAEYRNKLRKCEQLIGRPIGTATARDLATLKAKLRTMHSGPEYARTLGMFYRAGGKPDLAALCAMKQRNRVIKPDEVLTPKDVQAMIQATTTKRNAALIGALWDTGGRVSEVLSANLGEVSKSPPDDKIPLRFRLFFAQTKTDEPQEAWVTDTARVLDAWIRSHPFADDPKAPLFANADGSRLGRKRAWALTVAAARRAKVGKKVWPHLFRHSRATYLLRIGVSEPNVKKLLGWSARSTQLARYGHLVSGDAYRAVLRAQGFDVPMPETVERITLEDDSLLPVVPVLPSGADRAERTRDDAELGRIAELLSDPEVRAFLARRLRTSTPATA